MVKLLKSVLFPVLVLAACAAAASAGSLEEDWNKPPQEARIRASWIWLNGNVTKEAITRDLEAMKAKGFGGALLRDFGGVEQGGNERVPAGPSFASPEWRELFKHAVAEADRLGLELSLSISSGRNLGGPSVTPSTAVKKLIWSETVVKGPGSGDIMLLRPRSPNPYYEDLFILACRRRPAASAPRKPLANLQQKILQEKLRLAGGDAWIRAQSAPDTHALFVEERSDPGEEDCEASTVVDITDRLSPEGVLKWKAPSAGEWMVYRFGCTLADGHDTSAASDSWKGLALDVYDADAVAKYWREVVEPLVSAAGLHAGQTLKYLHTESWDLGLANWTPSLLREFRTRRGYDPLPYMPVFGGMIIDNRETSDRFLADYRKTLAELALDNHYKLLASLAAKRGLQLEAEAGGPRYAAIDAQKNFGAAAVPVGEFWAESPSFRTSDAVRFFVKQPASSAHTRSQRYVGAQAFRSMGLHWQERLWENLKPSFDHAACEGVNRIFWHTFVCSPEEMGIPGQQYGEGTHLNEQVTWWDRSEEVFAYFNRCQTLLQRGLFVADALFYYGDHAPNYAQNREADQARLGKGFDYDVIDEEALLSRVRVENGLLTLPDGMSYRLLVLPDYPTLSLPVLRRLRDLVSAGAKIVGPKPAAQSSLAGRPDSDAEFRRLADELWKTPGAKGCVVSGQSPRDLLGADGVAPDFEPLGEGAAAGLEYLHRRENGAEWYFVANRGSKAVETKIAFRVAGRAPEFWNPLTGERRAAPSWSVDGTRTLVPCALPPCGSVFVVFRREATAPADATVSHEAAPAEIQELNDTWLVSFDKRRGGPEEVSFDQLRSWSRHSDLGVRFYSGTASYRQGFFLDGANLPKSGKRLFLDLGDVREMARVKLNGKAFGLLWAPPFRLDISEAVREGNNELEIEVTNFWPNRLIGDQISPVAQRTTKTNVRKVTRDSKLMESGLLGPVRLLLSTP